MNRGARLSGLSTSFKIVCSALHDATHEVERVDPAPKIADTPRALMTAYTPTQTHMPNKAVASPAVNTDRPISTEKRITRYSTLFNHSKELHGVETCLGTACPLCKGLQ